jgi:type III secretion system FlhB-like substrate exporter
MNPVRQAIALEYGAHAVPMVTAKGDGAVADMIVEEARKQGVYVSQDPSCWLCSAGSMWTTRYPQSSTPPWP